MQKFSIEVVGLEIKRDHYLNKLRTKKHNGLIKVITGMRRCGKSYLLFTLFKKHLQEIGVDADHIIEIAFDSLLRNDDTFKKIIVVKDTPALWYTDDGILVISVYDFLLNADSLDI